ncbi:hypothetical protein [Hymenobacter arizonensis]|nr:hypothetical protein [Hymenobacter arizonensis]
MKYLLFLSFLWSALPAFAQVVPSPPDQYCLLEVTPIGKDRDRIKLLASSPEWAPKGQAEEAERVKGMAFEADALIYMSTHGWHVVQVMQKLNEHVVYLRRHQP